MNKTFNFLLSALLACLIPNIPSSTTTIGTQDIRDGAVTNVKVASAIDAVKIGDGSVSNTEFQRLDGVTSGIQTQIDGKAATSHVHAAGDITSGTLALARGGTNADLSASGGTTQFLAQDASHVVSSRAIAVADIPTLSSANVATIVSDETGTGLLVLGTTPTLTGPVFAAGTTSANSTPRLTSGTLLTTPQTGALEYDGTAFYFTAAASSRQVVPTEQFIISNGTYTLSSTTSTQQLFNSPASGALTLQASTTYFFEGYITLSSMSATSGNGFIDVLGAGTATVTSASWFALGSDGSLAQGAISTTKFSSLVGSGNMFTSAVGTNMLAYVKGVVRINAGGTVIPSVGLTTAASAVVATNSYFRFTPVGSNTVVSVGNWN